MNVRNVDTVIKDIKEEIIMEIIKCKCGCNININKYDIRGREKHYVRGHSNKGKSNDWKIKSKVKKRTSHERAVKLFKNKICFINNKQCSKRLEIHHIDFNPFNNKKANLVCLCTSHHRLLHLKKITLMQLHQLFNYYIDKSGKRRYTW